MLGAGCHVDDLTALGIEGGDGPGGGGAGLVPRQFQAAPEEPAGMPARDNDSQFNRRFGTDVAPVWRRAPDRQRVELAFTHRFLR